MKKTAIVLMSLFFSVCAFAQSVVAESEEVTSSVKDIQRMFIKEIMSFLEEEQMSPQKISNVELGFSYRENDYSFKMKEGEMNPFVISIAFERPYDAQVTKEFVSAFKASDGMEIVSSDDSFAVRAEAMAMDVESIKYAFYRMVNKLDAAVKKLLSSSNSQSKADSLDQMLWLKTDKNSEESLRTYIDGKTGYGKKHLNEAKTRLADLTHERLDREWRDVDTADLASVKEFVSKLDPKDDYLKPETEKILSKLTLASDKKADSQRKVKEAMSISNGKNFSDVDLKRAFDLMSEAAESIEFNEEERNTFNDLKDLFYYLRFSENKTRENAVLYLSSVENGKHKTEFENWLREFDSELSSCNRLRSKIKSETDSFDEYAAASAHSSNIIGEYRSYLKKVKREYIRSNGGCDFRFGGGVAAVFGDSSKPLAFSAELKFGNAFRPVSLTAGFFMVLKCFYKEGYVDINTGKPWYDPSYIFKGEIKVNLFKVGKKCRFYISPGGGYELDDESPVVIARTGFQTRFFDISAFGYQHLASDYGPHYGVGISFYL